MSKFLNLTYALSLKRWDCVENLPKALVGVHLLRWIATYPVDKVIRSLNNWGQVLSFKKVFFWVVRVPEKNPAGSSREGLLCNLSLLLRHVQIYNKEREVVCYLTGESQGNRYALHNSFSLLHFLVFNF